MGRQGDKFTREDTKQLPGSTGALLMLAVASADVNQERRCLTFRKVLGWCCQEVRTLSLRGAGFSLVEFMTAET